MSRERARAARRNKGRVRPVLQSASGGSTHPIPVISSLSSGTPNANDATITWTTDYASDSQVFWGLTAAYGGASSPIMDFTYTTSHSVQITGLTAATTYHYKVLTRTPGGAYAESADGTFETAP